MEKVTYVVIFSVHDLTDGFDFLDKKVFSVPDLNSLFVEILLFINSYDDNEVVIDLVSIKKEFD